MLGEPMTPLFCIAVFRSSEANQALKNLTQLFDFPSLSCFGFGHFLSGSMAFMFCCPKMPAPISMIMQLSRMARVGW